MESDVKFSWPKRLVRVDPALWKRIRKIAIDRDARVSVVLNEVLQTGLQQTSGQRAA
ncbi:MAG: hypothetical protein AB1664_10985 [Thermodesulfobacteriota bacterium]